MEDSTQENQNQERRRPQMSVFVRGVQVSQWSNTNKEGKEYKTFTLSKINRDVEGKIHYNNSFSLGDIPNLIIALEEMYKKDRVRVHTN